MPFLVHAISDRCSYMYMLFFFRDSHTWHFLIYILMKCSKIINFHDLKLIPMKCSKIIKIVIVAEYQVV